MDRGRAVIADAERSGVSPTEGERDWTAVNPPCPKFGTHHTKCFILVYDTGVRVCVHTANLIHGDVRKRTNAAWCQDFPNKSAAHLGRTSEFERDLGRYLATLGWKDETCALPGAGRRRRRRTVRDVSVRLFGRGGQVDCLGARPLGRIGDDELRTRLRASRAGGDDVPGRVQARTGGVPVHERRGDDGEVDGGDGAELFARGRRIRTTRKNEWPRGPCLGDGDLRLVWPTMGEVRGSNLGYVTGGSIPGATDKISREHVRRRLHRWRGGGDETTKEGTKLLDHPPASTDPTGRGRVMPHVKTFARYAPNAPHDLAWVIVGSHNLSGAAWGRLRRTRRKSRFYRTSSAPYSRRVRLAKRGLPRRSRAPPGR